ncbi:hypothetical protein MRB53_033665 [Persea americana]|uniref:Uncharacterized protein n=1 Tax=Persea americana TaxID=3435 RepID=A0ACC2KVP5_PERAE|nr:hypothetical protein MRB53_033665 [Persea americana]
MASLPICLYPKLKPDKVGVEKELRIDASWGLKLVADSLIYDCGGTPFDLISLQRGDRVLGLKYRNVLAYLNLTLSFDRFDRCIPLIALKTEFPLDGFSLLGCFDLLLFIFDMLGAIQDCLKTFYVVFAFCFALFLGAFKALLVGPVAALLMIVGNVAVILGLFPAHVAWTVYALVKVVGITRSVSKFPTYRRRFSNVVKALILYSSEREGSALSHSNRSSKSVSSIEVV